jgi:hypothetical protein
MSPALKFVSRRDAEEAKVAEGFLCNSALSASSASLREPLDMLWIGVFL